MPFAKTTSMSLVLISPSTVIRLNDMFTASVNAFCNTSGVTAASVVIRPNTLPYWDRSCRRLGHASEANRYTPYFNHIPTGFYKRICRHDRLGCFFPAEFRQFSYCLPDTGRQFSMGNGTPMTPVDATTTASGGISSNEATCFAVFLASVSPCSPVQRLRNQH